MDLVVFHPPLLQLNHIYNSLSNHLVVLVGLQHLYKLQFSLKYNLVKVLNLICLTVIIKLRQSQSFLLLLIHLVASSKSNRPSLHLTCLAQRHSSKRLTSSVVAILTIKWNKQFSHSSSPSIAVWTLHHKNSRPQITKTFKDCLIWTHWSKNKLISKSNNSSSNSREQWLAVICCRLSQTSRLMTFGVVWFNKSRRHKARESRVQVWTISSRLSSSNRWGWCSSSKFIRNNSKWWVCNSSLVRLVTSNDN